MTKSEEKQRIVISTSLSRFLKQFKNDYFQRVLDYDKKKLEELALTYPELQTKDDCYKANTTYQDAYYNRFLPKVKAQQTLDTFTLHAFEILQLLEKEWQRKFNNVVEKIAYEKITLFEVHEIRNAGSELEFLVQEYFMKEEDRFIRRYGKVVHARVIIASGPIVRPHYRFITTTRRAKS